VLEEKNACDSTEDSNGMKEIIDLINKNRKVLAEYHVQSLSLFGSVVREEDGPESDIDILVEFDPEVSVGLFNLVRLQKRLSGILGKPVDLATPDSLHKALKDQILKEAVRAA
jgi:hypothetical protein